MRRNLWLRIGIVAAVIVGSLIYLYPPPFVRPPAISPSMNLPEYTAWRLASVRRSAVQSAKAMASSAVTRTSQTWRKG